MPRKTWFLPPDFTFLPDGQIALGMAIPDPKRPTVTLASLAEHPSITLPAVRSIVEKNRSFSAEKHRSFGISLLAKFLDRASINNKVDIAWRGNKSFSAVDHEVRAYSEPFRPETLSAIVALEQVKRHVNSGRFGKRCVYIITGLRVAQQSFTISEEQAKTTTVLLEGSGNVPAGVVPVELGGGVSGSRGDTQTEGYETAPGIVFAYRLHVIRPKGEGGEGELFSDRTGFCTGEGENEDEEEMEIVEVDGDVILQDLDLDPGSYDKMQYEQEEGSPY